MEEPEITEAHVEAALEGLAKAKEARAKSPTARNHRTYREKAQEAADLRSAWRQQEVAAGRRSAGMGVSTGKVD